MFTLSNLDLAAYSALDGTLQDNSNSALDNVEQVRSTAGGDLIYKVTAGAVDGQPGEPFALAATRPVTALATPQPAVALDTTARGAVRAGQDVDVTATVSNPSPDLAAPQTQVTLALPSGVQLVAGDPTQSLGTLSRQGDGAATGTAHWTVRGITDGLKQLSATATASVYGATLVGSASRVLTVDESGPGLTFSTPSGRVGQVAIPLSWAAADPSGVAGYEIEVALNGGPFLPWLSATSQTTATYIGAPGNSYRFRLTAHDLLGNSNELTSEDVVIPRPTDDSRPTSLIRTNLAVVARRMGARLRLRGSLDPTAVGRVNLSWQARLHRRRYTARAHAAVHAGTFGATLRIPRRAVVPTRSVVTVRYSGDERFAPQTKRFVIYAR